MNKYIPEKINLLDEYIPDNASYRIRVDANESPFLPSEAMMADMKAAFESIPFNRYPDSTASALVSAYSKIYGIEENCVVAGNGSDELISVISQTFLSPGDKIMVVLPDFSMYEFYAKISGAEVVKYTKHNDFEIDFPSISREVAENGIKMVIFSNPCNPTGKCYPKADIEKFVSETDALIVVDEAYMEFCESGCGIINDYEKYENLIVLKTLSKAFGLASMRCGFAVGQAELISAIKKVKSPYNVNIATQKVAAAALSHYEEIKENTAVMISERKKLAAALSEMAKEYGFKVYNSDTNFVFAELGDAAEKVYLILKEKSIKIRCMGKYIRVTASFAEETDEVIRELDNACKMVYNQAQ